MAEKRVVSAFPQPPSFYKNYASEETSRPPPAPLTGIYQVFGEVHNTELENNPPAIIVANNKNKKEELRDFVRSLCIQYSKLLETLVNNPKDGDFRLIEIDYIFSNIHFLLNEYRPHQARRILVKILEYQAAQRRQAIDNIKEQKTKILQMLSDIEKLIADPESVLLGDKEENAEMEDKKVDLPSGENWHDLQKMQSILAALN